MYALVLFAVMIAGAVCAAEDISQQLRTTLVSARNKSMRGDFSGARTALDTALAVSPDSPDLLDGLGALQQDMGDYLQAEKSYRKALAMLPPGNDLRRARMLNDLATLYFELRQHSKLDGVVKELEAIPFDSIEPSPPDAATILSTLAGARRLRGDPQSAERLYERSIEFWSRLRNAEAMVGYVTTSLGNMHVEEGNFEEAAVLFTRAIGTMEASVGPDHAMLTRPLYGLAACKFLSGSMIEAESIARRAVEIARYRMGDRHPYTAKMITLEAQVLRKTGRKREAGTLEKEANAILRDTAERNVDGFTVDIRDLSRKKPRG